MQKLGSNAQISIVICIDMDIDSPAKISPPIWKLELLILMH